MCAVTTTTALSPVATERPLSIALWGSTAWVLLADTAGGAPAVTLRRTDGDGPATVTPLSRPLASPGVLTAVSALVATPQGPAFAVARGRAVTALLLADPPREVTFPRGETPAARDLLTPAITLAPGLSVLARWPAPWGVHRLQTRDAYESPAYTPARRDAFAAPDVTLLGDTVLVVQEHRVGQYTTDTEARREIELTALPASPWGLAPPRITTLSSLVAVTYHPRTPRIAPVDPDAPGRGVVAIWHDDRGVLAARAVEDRPAGWQLHEVVRVADDAFATDALSVAPAPGACPTVIGYRRERPGQQPQLVARAVDIASGRAGAPAETPAGAPGTASRVSVARAGVHTYMAAGDANGVRLWEVLQSADCGVSLRVVNLPVGDLPGSRLVGVVGDGSRAVLAMTPAPTDAPTTALTFVTVDAVHPERAAVAAPAGITVRFGVTSLALASDAVLVAGRGPNGAWVQRVTRTVAPGTEPGEDLLFRGARGLDLALTASARHHRVWLADVSGDEPSAFGPPRSVVLYSAVEALEDGPRTEVRTGLVPDADFQRLTLDPVRLTPEVTAWGATWSAGTATEGECIPGAWAALYASSDDRRMPLHLPDGTSPWPYARALVEPSLRRCTDTVQSAVWNGATVTAVVTGEALGARLVTGDVLQGPVRSVPLDASAGAGVTAGLVRAGNGWLVAWTDATGTSRTVHYRVFRGDGSPAGATGVLATGVSAPDGDSTTRGLALTEDHGRVAVAYATALGPRITRARCGAP